MLFVLRAMYMHCHGASGCCSEPFRLVFRVVSYALIGVLCFPVRRKAIRDWCDGGMCFGEHGADRIEFFKDQRHHYAETNAQEVMAGYDYDDYKDEPAYVAEYYVYDPKFPDWDYDTPVTPPPSWWCPLYRACEVHRGLLGNANEGNVSAAYL